MSDGNPGDGILSVDDAALALLTDPQGQPDEQDVAEQDDTEEETEEAAEQTVNEDTEDDGDTEEESEDESEPEDDEDLYVEIDGELVSLSELRNWQKAGLRQADYTKKTQAVAESRKELEAREQDLVVRQQQFQADKDAANAELSQLKAQLQEAITTLAVDTEREPNWVQLAQTLDPKAFQQRQAQWADKQAKRQQAAQVQQALKQQEMANLLARERAALLQHFPTWADPAVFKDMADKMVPVAGEYGFTQEEVAGITDHRLFRVLSELTELKAASAETSAKKAKAEKRVVETVKRVQSSGKPTRKPQSKQRQQKLDRLKKTGALQDAAAAILEM